MFSSVSGYSDREVEIENGGLKLRIKMGLARRRIVKERGEISTLKDGSRSGVDL